MRFFVTLAFLHLAVPFFAQSKENERFAWGFFATLETQSLGVQPLDTREPEKAAVQAGRPKAGGAVGFFVRKNIWRGLSFQPELSVSHNKNLLKFREAAPQIFRFYELELPLHFVLTDWRRRELPLRGCVIFGGRFGWNMAQNQGDRVEILQERFALDLGLGAELRLGNWRMQPAFVYSHGLNDIHALSDAEFDGMVGRMVRDKLSLRLSVWSLK
jgi:hypothetical protein